jgi:CRP-like cAMP-binding protein
MPNSFDLAELNIPQSSEIHALLKEFADIRTLRFEDGEYLIRQNEAAVDTFIVLSGSYVVEQSSAEDEERLRGTLAVVMSDLDSPSLVGEMAYLGGGFRTASVRSSGSTYTLRLKPKHVDGIIARFPFFTRVLCRQFTARLGEANQALRNMSMESELIMKKASEMVIEKGQKADTLYQLVEGSLVRDTNDEEIRPDDTYFGFIDPGPFFRNSEYESTVKTKTAASLVAISENSKLSVIRNFPELILKLYEEIAKRH